MDTAPSRELSDDECRVLLGRGGLGRVGVSVGALPAIFPVLFVVHADDIVFRTSSGGLLASAVSNAIVAFEADEVDRRGARAWSVLVVGASDRIVGRRELETVRGLPLGAWGQSHDDCFARISCERISGRMYHVPPLPDAK